MSQSISERVGAVYSLARTHLAWAAVLVQRDRADDHQRARDVATQALVVAEQRGYNTITRRATRLLDQLHP